MGILNEGASKNALTLLWHLPRLQCESCSSIDSRAVLVATEDGLVANALPTNSIPKTGLSCIGMLLKTGFCGGFECHPKVAKMVVNPPYFKNQM